jgi:general stress protein 26
MADEFRTFQEVTDGVRVAMLVLERPSGFRGRPLTVQKVEADAAWFLVGDDASWLPSDGERGNLTFVDDKKWVSAAGTVTRVTDPAVIEDLGDPVSDAWFQEGHDPVALRFDVHHGDWWTAPGFVTSAIKLVTAKVTGSEPSIGERGQVTT